MEILLVEDDAELAALLLKFLSPWYSVCHVMTPTQAWDALQSQSFSLCLLDLSLPEYDGLELCKEISEAFEMPIIISSARSHIDDKLHAFSHGAKDYLAKPYDPRELKARIELHYKKEAVQLHEHQKSVSFQSKEVALSLAEFEIFELLFRSPSRYFSKEEIALQMQSHDEQSTIGSVVVIINRLRKKLAQLDKGIQIVTLRNVGYRYEFNT